MKYIANYGALLLLMGLVLVAGVFTFFWNWYDGANRNTEQMNGLEVVSKFGKAISISVAPSEFVLQNGKLGLTALGEQASNWLTENYKPYWVNGLPFIAIGG